METFAQAVRRRRLGSVARACAAALSEAYELRANDLTEARRRLREGVAPFLAFARILIDRTPG
jgi:hypothetical protein